MFKLHPKCAVLGGSQDRFEKSCYREEQTKFYASGEVTTCKAEFTSDFLVTIMHLWVCVYASPSHTPLNQTCAEK